MYALGKFPSLSNTSCKLKWSWSTISLYSGQTSSCHRVEREDIDPDNFGNFHNTDEKIRQRETMLRGEWPTKGCEFCSGIEEAGGMSDRQMHNNIPTFPLELINNTAAVNVNPSIVEVFFGNKCNLACMYCHPANSSKIYHENKKFGDFQIDNVYEQLSTETPSSDINRERNKASFWTWMKKNSRYLETFNILGGEPFIQTEFIECLDFFEHNPSPMTILSVTTNLSLRPKQFKKYIDQIHTLVLNKKVRKLNIICSIDCWGAEQEYVRYGLDLNLFEQNMHYLLDQGDWVSVNINQAITNLTLNSMPELINKVNKWRTVKDIGHFLSLVHAKEYLQPGIFGGGFWKKEFDNVMQLMKQNTFNEVQAYNLMSGTYNKVSKSSVDHQKLSQFYSYLNEIDRRRGTNWKLLYPNLLEFKEQLNVV